MLERGQTWILIEDEVEKSQWKVNSFTMMTKHVGNKVAGEQCRCV